MESIEIVLIGVVDGVETNSENRSQSGTIAREVITMYITVHCYLSNLINFQILFVQLKVCSAILHN